MSAPTGPDYAASHNPITVIPISGGCNDAAGDLTHTLGKLDGTAIAGTDWVACHTASTVTIAAAPAWNPIVHALPRKPTALYPAGDHLRTTWAHIGR